MGGAAGKAHGWERPLGVALQQRRLDLVRRYAVGRAAHLGYRLRRRYTFVPSGNIAKRSLG
jgi:hypothetical protein